MLRVRPKNDATNRYRTNTRIPYLSSDSIIRGERIIWKKNCNPPERFKTGKEEKNKKQRTKTEFDESNSENSRLFKMFF